MVLLVAACENTVEGTPTAQRTQTPTAASSPSPTAAPPTTSSAPAAPPNVDETALDGLLLTIEETREIMAAPDLQIDHTYEEMPPSTVGYNPEECASAAFNTVEAGYRDSGFTAVRGVVLTEPEPMDTTHLVDQGVVAFPDAAAATDYITKTVEKWRGCAGQPFVVTRSQSTENWTFGEVTDNDGINVITKSAEGGLPCSHAIAAKANVVVDVVACSAEITDQAEIVLTRIRDKIPN
jgi:serine/threonine-protein kinase